MLLKHDQIRTLRLHRGWTQEQLAELAGISVRTVQRLEKTGVASMETTNALAAVFEVERVGLLAGGDDDPEPVNMAPVFGIRHLLLAASATFLMGLLVGQWL